MPRDLFHWGGEYLFGLTLGESVRRAKCVIFWGITPPSWCACPQGDPQLSPVLTQA